MCRLPASGTINIIRIGDWGPDCLATHPAMMSFDNSIRQSHFPSCSQLPAGKTAHVFAGLRPSPKRGDTLRATPPRGSQAFCKPPKLPFWVTARDPDKKGATPFPNPHETCHCRVTEMQEGGRPRPPRQALPRAPGAPLTPAAPSCAVPPELSLLRADGTCCFNVLLVHTVSGTKLKIATCNIPSNILGRPRRSL